MPRCQGRAWGSTDARRVPRFWREPSEGSRSACRRARDGRLPFPAMSARAHARMIAVASELSPRLEEAIARNGSLRLSRRWKSTPLVEVLCRVVAGQQLSVKAAQSIWGRVVIAAGDRTLSDHLLEAHPEGLRACGLSGAKTKTMRAIAEAAREGALEPGELASLDHLERSAHLKSIWGVGQWTADMISMFYFGDADVWPDGDVTARKTLARLTSRRRKTLRTAARFAPYRSYLALHMWQHASARPT